MSKFKMPSLSNLFKRNPIPTKTIGIFGYSGVGKTTYLASFFRQLSVDAYKHIDLNNTHGKTNTYLNQLISEIENAVKSTKGVDKDIYDLAKEGNLISPTKDEPIDLQFMFSTSGYPYESVDPDSSDFRTQIEKIKEKKITNHYNINIQDYMGEYTSSGRFENSLAEFFKSCNGVLIFLSPDLIDDDGKILDKRYSEIKTLTAFLKSDKQDEGKEILINVPIAIVVTKFDYIEDIVDTHMEYDTPEDFVDSAFSALIDAIKKRSNSGVKVFNISSLQGFMDAKNSGFYNKAIKNDSSRNLAKPFEWVIHQSNILKGINTKKKIRKIITIITSILLIVGGGFFYDGYNKYQKCIKLEESISVSPREAAKEWEKYLDGFYGNLLTPYRKNIVFDKIKNLYDEDENNHFTKITNAYKNSEYLKALNQIAIYNDLFSKGKHRDSVDLLQENSLYYNIVLANNQNRSPQTIIDKCDYYFDETQKNTYFKEVTKLRAEAEFKLPPPPQPVIPKSRSNEGCFIATSIYGSYDAEEVIVLRGFRDEVLQKSFLGRKFIDFYYDYSPSLADWLDDKKKISKDIKLIILDPIVEDIRKSNSN